jgi:hypothetical protein
MRNNFLPFILVLLSAAACSKEKIASREFPRIITKPATDITKNGAVFHGEIIFSSVEILDYGFVWSQGGFPTINSSGKASLGSKSGAGPFDATIVDDFIGGKEYTVRAYATSAGHVVYGDYADFVAK